MPSASIVKHGSGYRCVWREGGRGSKRRFGKTHDTKKLAQADADLVRARLLAEGDIRNRVSLEWSEVVTRWAKSRAPGRYADEAKAYLLKLPWQSVLDASPAAVADMPAIWQRITKACLRWAERMLDQPTPRRVLAVPNKRKRTRAVRPLMDDELVAKVRLQAQGFGPGDAALVHLLSTYGHRAESLVLLPCSAYDPVARLLSMEVKGGHRVCHPVLAETHDLLSALQEGRAPGAPLFVNHLGVAWETGQAFASWFWHAFGFGYYDLKRWAISRMLSAGLDAKTVASITGHRTVTLLLNTYARTNEQRQRLALSRLQDLSQVSATKVIT